MPKNSVRGRFWLTMIQRLSARAWLRMSLLVGLVLGGLAISRAPMVTAQSSTPTYVLGVSSLTDPLIVDLQNLTSSLTILSSASSLSVIGPNSILFIDGNWLQSVDPTTMSLVVTTVLNAVPTIVVRGNPAILQNAISGLLQFGAPGLPLISAGVKIINTLPDGTRQGAILQVLDGFDYAVSAEFTWAQQHLSIPSPLPLSPTLTTSQKISLAPTVTSSGSGPFWQFQLNLTTNTGDLFKPMGRVISTWTVFQLQNSGSSTFKWYNFFANQTILPGIEIYPSSQWRNYQENDTVNLNPQNPQNNTFVSHGPSSMISSGLTQISYSIGVTAGVLGSLVTSNQTQTYTVKGTNVTDSSQPPLEVSWIHGIDPRSSSGKITFQIMPGWTDRVVANSCSSKGIDLHGTFTTTFVTLTNNRNIDQTASTGVSLTASGC